VPAPIEHGFQASGGERSPGAVWSCARAVLDGVQRCAPKVLEHEKGVRWMPWRQEAMKDVARCEKPRGDASDR
jgi:hypothetical protein